MYVYMCMQFIKCKLMVLWWPLCLEQIFQSEELGSEIVNVGQFEYLFAATMFMFSPTSVSHAQATNA
jgi:hypothetical protein